MTIHTNTSHPGNPPHDPPTENPGPIASDSLAAESVRAGGAFAQNPHATPLSVAGGNSTLANTDTSGASVLHAAENNSAREREDARGAGADEKGAAGLKYPGNDGQPTFSGTTSRQGYVGGPGQGTGVETGAGIGAGASDFGATKLGAADSHTKDATQIRSTGSDFETGAAQGERRAGADSGESGSGSAGTTGVRPYVDAAPNYNPVTTASARSPGTYKPKGNNLEDADQTDSLPKTKTFTGDVGGPHDPARLAERDLSARDAGGSVAAEAARAAQGAQGSGGSTDQGQFGVLGSEAA